MRKLKMHTFPLLQHIFFQKNNRFLVLVISLVLFFTCYPITENSTAAKLVMNLFFMLIVLSAVYAISDNLKPLLINFSLALLIIALRWIHYFYEVEVWVILELCTNILFWAYTSVYILKFILKHSIISSELIFAGIAVYFILGLAWASIYQLIEISHPHSFLIATLKTDSQNLSFHMWYFSMVTLTTLGYGDISPVTMSARVFVVLEAILGQFYLAILIASLVGRSIAQRSS
ncbi:MAG: voltage-gated potassium channel [Methyloprofundus sp.]|nr:MAG: voltage-gated potassium channel [Methyloprofundus sp.]